ncbi:alpha/beta fold hydrolase [Paenarthrobacter aromaticivorans]|uniref:Alpha/beta hydrolase n=1 Tax=Paenarthrobacter aromaticivorans TaxID=2849150 RepID=A0ABS6I455_9MICC|nr:alpha/beta hydrolase [Paenarthrobacter sp. MMS21-TAE1-1]MBU8865839.1 alpha/beta hydrolase [Paenarthrobacter sp. MMS21-TAE1-1]
MAPNEPLILDYPQTSTERLRHRVVCLHKGAGAGAWYARQVAAYDAHTWEDGDVQLPGATISEGQLNEWVSAAAAELRDGGATPVHLVASGSAAYGTIVLAGRYPCLVKSLILGDPEVDTSIEGYAPALQLVQAPSLVIAAAPRADTDIAGPQSIAGGIDNGVFVIIEDTAVPAHRTKADSFNEWATSFMNIAEGLHTFADSKEEFHA